MATTPHTFASGEKISADDINTHTSAIVELQTQPAMAAGQVDITTNSSATYFSGGGTFYTGSANITLPTGLFSGIPSVRTSLDDNVPGFFIESTVDNVTASGFTIRLARFSSATYTCYWQAIGQTTLQNFTPNLVQPHVFAVGEVGTADAFNSHTQAIQQLQVTRPLTQSGAAASITPGGSYSFNSGGGTYYRGTQAVTFNTPFPAKPSVVVTGHSGVPGNFIEACAYNVSTTGFTAVFARADTTVTDIYWLAVEQTQ